MVKYEWSSTMSLPCSRLHFGWPSKKLSQIVVHSRTAITVQTVVAHPLCAELHYTNTGYWHHQRTSSQQVVDVVQHVRIRLNLMYNILPATDTTKDELITHTTGCTQQSHHQRTKICHIPKSWHVEMLGSGIAMWQICCRIVVSSSVGGVRSRCPCSGVWAYLWINCLQQFVV